MYLNQRERRVAVVVSQIIPGLVPASFIILTQEDVSDRLAAVDTIPGVQVEV